MNVASIKVTLELEGGEEVVAALADLLKRCDGRVVASEVDTPAQPVDRQEQPKQLSRAEQADWAAGEIAKVVSRYILECKDLDGVLDRCGHNYIMWLYKALLGVKAADSAKSAGLALEALGADERDIHKVEMLIGVLNRTRG